MEVNNVDICIGLCWGDEAKGKLVSELLKINKYDFVCRWSGSSNAGHTIYINDIKHHTHIIPAGIFYGIPSIIGPDCYINENEFQKEIEYLDNHGFDTSLVKISPRAHIITDKHIEHDKKNKDNNSSTGKGVAPCASDKFNRKGVLFRDISSFWFKKYIWDEKLHGNILCEGAQGFWLDINHGNYPYVTSSYTLPYSACSLGFPTQCIRHIYGAAKIYDTRVGTDPLFDDDLFDKNILEQIAVKGNEYGTTTGRPRKVKWLNLDLLIKSINISGTTHIVISKIDIFNDMDELKIYFNNEYVIFKKLSDLLQFVRTHLYKNCCFLRKILYSDNPKSILNL